MKQKGFSLIESLIYAMLLAFTCILAFSWLSNSLQGFRQTNIKSAQVMMAHAALARMSADVQMAQASENKWKSESKSFSLHCMPANQRIRWLLEKDKLYRIQGTAKALIATGISDFAHTLKKNNDAISGLTVRLGFDAMMFEKQIRVYNG
ncbi:hypothetical protein BH09DEP1_BH09DEP1_2610 [soil metagenome]